MKKVNIFIDYFDKYLFDFFVDKKENRDYLDDLNEIVKAKVSKEKIKKWGKLKKEFNNYQQELLELYVKYKLLNY